MFDRFLDTAINLLGIVHLVRTQKFSEKLTFLTYVCVSGGKKC